MPMQFYTGIPFNS